MTSETKHNQQNILRAIWHQLAVPLGAILLAMLIGAVILIISGANPIIAYGALLRGAFGNTTAIARTLEKATPLIFSGLAISLAFKAGMFNIGAQGQLTFGAIIAAFIGFAVEGIPWYFHGPLAILGGAMAGALYGAIPGLLKAFTGAHEVITTIMLNYIALNFTDWLVGGAWQDKSTAILLPRTPLIAESAFINKQRLISTGLIYVILGLYVLLIGYLLLKNWKKVQKQKSSFSMFFASFRSQFLLMLLPIILIGLYIFNTLEIGFILAVGAAFVVWWLLEKTTVGFEIRMVGSNSQAARYAGIKVAGIIILTLAMSGLLAGLGGAIETTGVDGRFEPGFNVGLGFDGITIALLAKTHPLGNIPAALLIGAMKAGASTMQFEAGVPKEIIDVIQSLMLFFVAADVIIRRILRMRESDEKVSLTSGWGQH